METAVLVVSELVTNAVQHAPSAPIELIATHGDGLLLLEIRDGSGEPPVLDPELDEEDEGCRGLRLVQAMSSDWGRSPLGDTAKCTWAALPVGNADCQS
ncbi:ATP-binding protein [Streptomyces sp. NPDC005408]|uniref:ATP-binding protein n=1 Tax=Streptomyces sp. NPDC005408 TaxID=3155341 RepID=UPI0033BF0BC2